MSVPNDEVNGPHLAGSSNWRPRTPRPRRPSASAPAVSALVPLRVERHQRRRAERQDGVSGGPRPLPRVRAARRAARHTSATVARIDGLVQRDARDRGVDLLAGRRRCRGRRGWSGRRSSADAGREDEAGQGRCDRSAGFVDLHACIEAPSDVSGMWDTRPRGDSQRTLSNPHRPGGRNSLPSASGAASAQARPRACHFHEMFPPRRSPTIPTLRTPARASRSPTAPSPRVALARVLRRPPGRCGPNALPAAGPPSRCRKHSSTGSATCRGGRRAPRSSSAARARPGDAAGSRGAEGLAATERVVCRLRPTAGAHRTVKSANMPGLPPGM